MDWRLIFSGLKSPGWLVAVSLCVIVAVGLSAWLLRLERRLVSRTVGGILLSLRMLVLFILLVTLLQPVLTRQFDVTQRGRIVVAIDASHSMDSHDRHAPLAEKLRWAQALGMIGNGDTAELLNQWVAAAESGEEPNWDGSSPESGMMDQSRSIARKQQVMAALEEVAAMPRTEFVQRLLQSQPQQLLGELNRIMPVDLRLFATDQQTTTEAALSERLRSDRQSLRPQHSDLLKALESFTAEDGAGQVQAIVLISDGRQSLPGDLSGVSQLLAGIDVPVYAVPIGSRVPPRDLSIVNVDTPEAVFLNDKAQVKATIGAAGFEGESLTVRLEKDGQLVEQQTITPSGDSGVVTFSVPSDQVGRFNYQVATDVHEGELRDDNNSRDVTVQVVDNKARVMLVDGDPRWEFRYLKNVLDRDKQIEPQVVLFHQPSLKLLDEAYIPGELPPQEAFREALAKTDLLIIGDVEPEQIETGVWELIEQAVARDGLTVVVIPGRRAMPDGFQSATLSNLLPVKDFQQRVAEQFQKSLPDASPTAFQLTMTAESVTLPMFQLSENNSARELGLTSLPGHPWFYAGIPKPGAVVWANASIASSGIAPEPAIVHHDYGFGQVVWLGIDSTWRWRMRSGDEKHYRFWGQLIRWAARNKSAAGNSDVRLTLTDAVINESEPVDAVVRWNPDRLPQIADATLTVIASRVDVAPAAGASEPNTTSVQFTTSLQAAADSPERFTGRLATLSPGLWQIELEITGGSISLNERVKTELLVRRRESAELANMSCNRNLLKQLSETTNGQLIEPYDTSRLLSLLRPEDQTDEKVQEKTLWDHWAVLITFFCVLTSEWVIRKLHGLP